MVCFLHFFLFKRNVLVVSTERYLDFSLINHQKMCLNSASGGGNILINYLSTEKGSYILIQQYKKAPLKSHLGKSTKEAKLCSKNVFSYSALWGRFWLSNVTRGPNYILFIIRGHKPKRLGSKGLILQQWILCVM